MDRHMQDIPPQIGPHEGRELDLMLAGEKPAAMFSDVVPASMTLPEAEFQPHVDAGRLVMKEDILRDKTKRFLPSRFVYYALPQEAWRIDVLRKINRLLFQDGYKTNEITEYMIGFLLGYSDEDVGVYISRFFNK